MLKFPQARNIQTLPLNFFNPTDYLFENWPFLFDFLTLLFSRKPASSLPLINLQSLYLMVEQICRNQQQKELLLKLEVSLDSFLQNSLESINLSEDFAGNLSIYWSLVVNLNIPILSGVFRYFESIYLKPVLRLKNFESFLFTRFSTIMIKLPHFHEKVIFHTLDLVRRERISEPFSLETLINIWQLIQKVSPELYSEFEPKFIQQSQEFYRAEAKKLITDFDLSAYVSYVDKRIALEAEKTKFFREAGTEASVAKVLEVELIEKSLEKVLDVTGLAYLIEKKDVASLERIYRQVSRVNKLENFRKSWLTALKELTRALMGSAKETTLIESILSLRKDALNILKEAFQGNKALRSAIDSAISASLDSNPNKAAELASKEFDIKLRKRKNAMMFSEDAAKLELDEIFEVFRYISAKDMFEEFYTRRLVKRLLFGGVSSQELEVHVLEKLKKECGPSYIKKAEEIFKDFDISKQINSDFANLRRRRSSVDFYVTVLHSNSWPLANSSIPSLIEPFETMKLEFAEFYAAKQPGAILAWQFEGSFCELYGYFRGEKYLLNVSILQAMILLLFNGPAQIALKKTLAFKEICNLLPFNQEELKKGLYSLYLMKEKVLLKSGSEPKSLSSSDEFRLNETYQSKTKIVKINSVSKKETANEIKDTEEKVLQERQYVIDAAIVRILKAKKTIGHNELVNEVFNDLKLPITVSDTKKRIESLIGRDFLVRDKNNTQLYHYVA